MKTKLLCGLLFFTIVNLKAQCPGAKAIEYKNKAQADSQNAGAYVNLAAYYAYKCECETGTSREADLIKAMNYHVDTNSGYYKNRFGTITKVTKCKKADGSGGNAQNSSDTGQSGNTVGSGLGFTRELENVLSSTLGADNELTKAFQNYNIGADFGNKIASGNVTGNDLAGFASHAFGDDSGIAQNLDAYAKGENLRNALESGNATDIISSGLQVASLFEVSPEEKERRIKEREAKREKKWQEKLDKQFNIERTADGSSKREVIDEQQNIKSIIYLNANNQNYLSENFDLKNNNKIATVETIKFQDINSISVMQEVIETDYVKNTKKHIFYNSKIEPIKVIDLLTDEILYDKSQSVFEDILNKQGNKIGTLELYNGLKVKSDIEFNGKKEINNYDENGKIFSSIIYLKKEKLSKLEKTLIKSNPEFELYYKYNLIEVSNFNTNGSLKTVETFSKDMRNTEKKYYENGVLTITKKFKDGKLVSKEK